MIYVIRIKARTGHQKDNKVWGIGQYLQHVHECDPGTFGGMMAYKPVGLYDATFCAYWRAVVIMQYMKDVYPGVGCEIVKFTMVD